MATLFEEKIEKQLRNLSLKSYAEIEGEVTQKRLAWLRMNHPTPLPFYSPRQAFELLFFEYMGLSKSDLPIIQESEREIVWHSQNPCPTLKACLRLHLDTRLVCRNAYEASTQAFIAYLDAKLVFSRSYEEIRPYYPYCREWIKRLE